MWSSLNFLVPHLCYRIKTVTVRCAGYQIPLECQHVVCSGSDHLAGKIADGDVQGFLKSLVIRWCVSCSWDALKDAA